MRCRRDTRDVVVASHRESADLEHLNRACESSHPQHARNPVLLGKESIHRDSESSLVRVERVSSRMNVRCGAPVVSLFQIGSSRALR